MALPDSCPLCGSGRDQQQVVTPHVYGDKGGMRAFYYCGGCDVRYQYPALTEEEEAKFYAAEFEGFMAGRSGTAGGWQGAESHIRSNESTRLRRMKYLSPHLFPGASILEVGCSSGFMLFPLKDNGYKCLGVEPSGVFSEYVRSRGVAVYSSLDDLVENCPGQKFDIIQHFFVLEHITKPQAFLELQLALLKPGGKIILEVPNAADPLYSVYDIPAFERFYWSLAHPWYFSEASLRFLLDRLNQTYEILLDQRYDFSNHMVWARDGKPGGMGRFTSVLGNEMEELYKRELIKQKRCDTLIAIITKDGGSLT